MKSKSIQLIFQVYNFFLKLWNYNAKKIFIYTDSRGYDVINKYGKIPFQSYVHFLARKYRLTYQICPEKFTTIVDFLNFYETHNLSKYDYIILHCGIVDFSPRPYSNIEKVKKSKLGKKLFDEIFDASLLYHEKPFEVEYYGEKTSTLYSPNCLNEIILPRLLKIDNLIWINSNNFVRHWEGNFSKGRPKNINEVVNNFDSILAVNLSNVIDLKSWDDEEIKRFTIDNIHFNSNGFNKIYTLIDNFISKKK